MQKIWIFCEDEGISEPAPVPVAVFTDEALALRYKALWPDRWMFEIDGVVNPPMPDG